MSNQTTFRGGPAYLVYDSLTLKMREDWQVQNPDQFFDIPSATGVGETKGIADKMGKITFTPKVFLASLASFWSKFVPYTNPSQTSALLRPATDKPAVVHARFGGTSNLGLTATFYAAMVSKQPTLTFAPDKPLMGPIELTTLLALGTQPGDSTSYVDTANATYTEPAWTVSDELFDRYTLTLGAIADNSNPVTIVTDKDGIQFDPAVTIEWIKPSQEPTRDGRFAKITGKLSFRPHNMDVDTFYSTYFPESGGLGSVLEANGYQANITGTKVGGATLLIPQVVRAKTGLTFSTKNPRTDRVELEAVQYCSSGTWQPLFTLGVVPTP